MIERAGSVVAPRTGFEPVVFLIDNQATTPSSLTREEWHPQESNLRRVAFQTTALPLS